MHSPRTLQALSLVFLTLMLGLSARGAERFNTVYLSEFLALNQRGLLDDDGDHSGWIELHNGGKAAVNLAGWFLTDSRTNLAKWKFPGVVVLPDKYLLVFASGKDRTKVLAHLHTNFRLDAADSALLLVDPNKNIVSEFTPQKQTADVSDGRVRGEPTTRGFFTRPTPSWANASSGKGFAPKVVFSQAGGNFTEPFALQLATGIADAVVRYTLDGSLPSPASPVFSAPLLLTNSTHLRARAYQTGLLPGPPRSEVFLRLHTNALAFTSSLPLLIMHQPAKDTPVSARNNFVHLSFFDPVAGRASLTNAPALTTRGGFHMRGSSSMGMPQASWAVHFLDEFNDEKKQAAAGLPSESEWVLYAPNGFDPPLIHNPFIHQLSRDMGRYSPRTRFVEVFMNRGPGPVRSNDYHGVYVLEEKIKIGKNRVDIDRLGGDDLKAPAVTGGYVLKIDRTGPDEGGFGAGGTTVVHVEPKEATLRLPQRAPQRDYLLGFFRDFDRVLQGPNWKDPVLGYPAYFDVAAGIDFHVLEVLSGNVDAIVLSTYFHKPRNGKITFGPHWDFDRALGSTDGRDADPRQWNTGPFFSGPWWPRLFSDPDFWQRWVDRWQELRGTHFSVTNLCAVIDRQAGELRDAQPREYKRWGFQPRGGSYQSELNHMKNWLSNRVDFIDRQLTQPPRVTREGGGGGGGEIRLALAAATTNATIYFTLDGTDPRLPQGAIRTNAFVYSVPVTLKGNAQVVARAHNAKQRQSGGPPISTPWSGPVMTNIVVKLR